MLRIKQEHLYQEIFVGSDLTGQNSRGKFQCNAVQRLVGKSLKPIKELCLPP